MTNLGLSAWHLPADPTARFHDLGPDYHATRLGKDRKARNRLRQLRGVGFEVTLTPTEA